MEVTIRVRLACETAVLVKLRRGGVLLLLLLAMFVALPVSATCIAPSYILVKLTWDGTIFVALPDCTKDHSVDMTSLSFVFLEFVAEPPVVIWSGSGDPNAHTANPLTAGGAAVALDPPGFEWPYHFGTNSLKDIGTYVYDMGGTYCCWHDQNGAHVGDLSNDFMEWTVDNSPPEANVAVSGTLKVGNTLSITSGAFDADTGNGSGMHHQWSVTTRPPSSVSTFNDDDAASPTIALSGKHDIGDWTIKLDLADQQGELKSFSKSFTVVNQPPVLQIDGATDIDALTQIELHAGPDVDADGEDVTFVWDIMQAPPSAPEQPQSNFSTSDTIQIPTGPTGIGTWQFKCTATDEHDATDDATVTVTVTAVPPEIDLQPSSPQEIEEGETIFFETTILDDAYGDPLASMEWEVLQAPAGAAALGGFQSGASLEIPNAAPGTWIFKLTVTDQVGETAEETAKVLVDAQPTAEIAGPASAQNLTTHVQLTAEGSTDPDSPNTPPDYGHVHSGPPDVSLPTIQSYRWSVILFPPDSYGDYFQGPVADVLSVNDSSAVLDIPPGRLAVGDWTFEVEVTDAEGNTAYAQHSLQIVNPDTPPLALFNPGGPQYFATTPQNVLPNDVIVDGSPSFDLDNLLSGPIGPGTGITNYEWVLVAQPPLCGFPPAVLGSGPSASAVPLFISNTVIPPDCQGLYDVGLIVTDDDTPTPHIGMNATSILIGNCTGDICIDDPTEAAPEYIKFSDQTDVLILYHINSVLYDFPEFAAGLRARLEILYEDDPVPVFDRAWDIDLLPTNKGAFLATHWYGYDDLNQRPEPGRYTVRLSLVDGANNPTPFGATELNSIHIQRLDIDIDEGTSDLWLNANGIEAGTDQLTLDYTVSGGFGGAEFDELRYTIYEHGTSAIVVQDSDFGPFIGTFFWDGSIAPGLFIEPGSYDIVLEILEGGAKLGETERHTFHVYKTSIALAGVADADELDPGAFLEEKKTIDVTVKMEGPLAELSGDAILKTDDQPGTLTAKDGPVAVDIDAGVSIPVSSLGVEKTFEITGLAPGDAKTKLSLSYQPPFTGTSKKSQAQAAITVIRGTLRAASSDPATQETEGAFVAGAVTPVAVTPLNAPELKFRMRPVTVTVRPDVPGTTVELAFDSGGPANIELYDAAPPHAQVILPKSWAPADFSAHKLAVSLLAYGKSFGDVVLHLKYKKGATLLREEKLKLRVRPRPGMTGLSLPAFPFFRTLRTANLGVPLVAGLDPILHRERTGRRADVYLVPHRTSAQWAGNTALADVTGASKPLVVAAPSIANNLIVLGAPPAIGDYDVVYDFGNFADDPAGFVGDGKLDPGDILDDSLGGAVSASVKDSLTAPGAFATSTAEYDFSAAVPIAAGYDFLLNPFSFRLRGKLVWPTAIAGPSPLVVIAHGNHTPLTVGGVTVSSDVTTDENYRGYEYLQTHLASRGFVTMSVDLDEMTGIAAPGFAEIDGSASSGIKLRGWITLKNIEKVLADATVAGGALVGKIDPARIYLVGHSRGGEAVVVARHILSSGIDMPPGGSIAGFTGPGIRGVVSISPTSRDIEGGGITAPTVPFLLIYGSADGDVNGAMSGVRPFRHYDRAAGEKFAIRIEGANHNFFNTSWAFSDASEKLTGADVFSAVKVPRVPPVGASLTTAAQQRDLAKAYITAFATMLDVPAEAALREYFYEPPARLLPIGVDPALKLHAQVRRAPSPQTFVVDDFETNAAVALSSSGQAVSSTIAAVSLAETDLVDDPVNVSLSEAQVANRFFQETKGLLFDWSSANELVEEVAAAQQDFRGATALSFRVAQQPKHAETIALAGALTLVVELEDAAAKTSAVSISILDSAPGIYVAELNGTETTSAAFKTFRVPIAAFATDGRDIDLSQVRKIRFKLAEPGEPPRGRIAIDDVEVEK